MRRLHKLYLFVVRKSQVLPQTIPNAGDPASRPSRATAVVNPIRHDIYAKRFWRLAEGSNKVPRNTKEVDTKERVLLLALLAALKKEVAVCSQPTTTPRQTCEKYVQHALMDGVPSEFCQEKNNIAGYR